MKYTSAEAAKLLKKLNEEHAALIERECKSSSFIAAQGEELESVRPEYDFAATQKKLDEIEEKVRKVKHAINSFNLKTKVPGFGMTVDQLLVYIPQLTQKKSRLSQMALRLPKERVQQGYGNRTLVEYTYANYDPAAAEAELTAVSDRLAAAQTALDVLNNSSSIEIDL